MKSNKQKLEILSFSHNHDDGIIRSLILGCLLILASLYFMLSPNSTQEVQQVCPAGGAICYPKTISVPVEVPFYVVVAEIVGIIIGISLILYSIFVILKNMLKNDSSQTRFE